MTQREIYLLAYGFLAGALTSMAIIMAITGYGVFSVLAAAVFAVNAWRIKTILGR